MAKLYFSYSAMNAGKSTLLLQVAHNYKEQGMGVYLLTSGSDDRAGGRRIASRIGIEAESDIFTPEDDLFVLIKQRLETGRIACVLLDEAQFLSEAQVWQLALVADELDTPVMCYGVRTDFRGQLFPGSAALLALADDLREVRTICHCGRKATMTLRFDENGNVVKEGEQVVIGGNEQYRSFCRKHWRELLGMNGG